MSRLDSRSMTGREHVIRAAIVGYIILAAGIAFLNGLKAADAAMTGRALRAVAFGTACLFAATGTAAALWTLRRRARTAHDTDTERPLK